MPGKSTSGRKVAASASGKKPNALKQMLKKLVAVVGSKPLPRGEVVSKV